MGGVGVELFRYVLVSGIALACDVGLLLVLTEFAGLPYLVSAAIAFLAAMALAYWLSIVWVFRRRALSGHPAAEFAVFALVGVVGLGINQAVMAGFTELAGLHYALSKAIAIVFVFSWHFGARKLLLFRGAGAAVAPGSADAGARPC